MRLSSVPLEDGVKLNKDVRFYSLKYINKPLDGILLDEYLHSRINIKIQGRKYSSIKIKNVFENSHRFSETRRTFNKFLAASSKTRFSEASSFLTTLLSSNSTFPSLSARLGPSTTPSSGLKILDDHFMSPC